jgi:hypothetical protein
MVGFLLHEEGSAVKKAQARNGRSHLENATIKRNHYMKGNGLFSLWDFSS